MKETPISVTLAARKFADCVNLVRYQGVSFLLEKNGVPVARIVPLKTKIASDLEQSASTARPAPEETLSLAEEAQSTQSFTGQHTASEGAQQAPETSTHIRRPALNW